jgi:hypothetical protein
MSKYLSDAAITEFDSEVKHAYQGSQTLRQTVTVRTGVKGEAYKFTKMGKGIANQKASQADVTPMDITHSRQTATMENWNAPEYTDIFDQAEVNFDERAELAQTIAMALGRRDDQLIIDAANGSGTSKTIAAGGTGLTLAKVTNTSKQLNDDAVPSMDRTFVHSPAALEDLLNDTTITSADYNSVRLLMSGEIDTFMGFTWKMIENRTEGGLPLSGSDRTCLAYHKAALGIAVNLDAKTEVNYIAQKTSWLCNGIYKAGAVARDAEGIVTVAIQE